mmetsp:Transcript_9018/g.16756  ORF Transcript_9018/g.16756 Transcript_9018/m.16756 type:complete len:340 (+) Transcript_9018:2036-3055(+)
MPIPASSLFSLMSRSASSDERRPGAPAPPGRCPVLGGLPPAAASTLLRHRSSAAVGPPRRMGDLSVDLPARTDPCPSAPLTSTTAPGETTLTASEDFMPGCPAMAAAPTTTVDAAALALALSTLLLHRSSWDVRPPVLDAAAASLDALRSPLPFLDEDEAAPTETAPGAAAAPALSPALALAAEMAPPPPFLVSLASCWQPPPPPGTKKAPGSFRTDAVRGDISGDLTPPRPEAATAPGTTAGGSSSEGAPRMTGAGGGADKEVSAGTTFGGVGETSSEGLPAMKAPSSFPILRPVSEGGPGADDSVGVDAGAPSAAPDDVLLLGVRGVTFVMDALTFS